MSRLDAGRLALLALLLGLAAVGWIVTDERMAGMDDGPGTDLGSLGFYVSAWVVMMAAMMFPSVAPMVLAHRVILRRRRALGKHVPVGSGAVFVGGYLLSWTAFGLLAYALLAFVGSLSIDALAWDRAGPWVAGGVIVAAALYELTPAKDACLSRCRTPMHFVLGGWRDGRGGSLRLGVEHGAWCVGCCWGLMAALFAVGVMSVGWMAFFAALIALEKMLPWRVAASRAVIVLLLALGVAVALVPERVPGLRIPAGMEMPSGMGR